MTTLPEPSKEPQPALLSPGRIRLARMIAAGADFVQILAIPFLFAGTASPLNNVLDVIIGVVMIYLLGWHWAFLPTFITELVPFVDLFPTWTVAVFFVTRRKK